MAAKQSIIVASVLLLVFFVEQGSSIKCYDCNSNLDIRCALPYPPIEYVVNCDDLTPKTNLPYIFCRKVSQMIKVGINTLEPNSRVIRECASNITQYREDCYDRHVGNSAHQSICECDVSYCNGVERSSQISSRILLFVVFASALTTFIRQA